MSTALLVIDVQRIYTDSGSELFCTDAAKTIKQINALIATFQNRNDAVFLVRHIHKSDGSDLGRMFDYEGEEVDEFNFIENTNEIEYDPALNRPKDAIEIVKTRYSAFTGTVLQKELMSRKTTRVVICGFMTNFCCESTARDAHGLDYYVDFIIDATGTPGTETMDQDEVRRVVGELLDGFAVVQTTKDYVASN